MSPGKCAIKVTFTGKAPCFFCFNWKSSATSPDDVVAPFDVIVEL